MYSYFLLINVPFSILFTELGERIKSSLLELIWSSKSKYFSLKYNHMKLYLRWLTYSETIYEFQILEYFMNIQPNLFLCNVKLHVPNTPTRWRLTCWFWSWLASSFLWVLRKFWLTTWSNHSHLKVSLGSSIQQPLMRMLNLSLIHIWRCRRRG